MAERGKNKYLVESGNPRLLKNPVKGKTQYSLYLEYQLGYNRETGTSRRKKESLSLYLTANPRTPEERQKNKEKLEIARKIRFEKEQQHLENREGYRLKKSQAINFLDFFQSYIDRYKKKDIRVLEMALRDFKKFLTEEYPLNANRVEPHSINKDMMVKFTEFLSNNHRGSGVNTVYSRFKKVINYAVEQGVFKISPCRGVVVCRNEDILVKDILSAEELQQLFATHHDRENPVVRRAFAMTCLSGIRFCDLKRLTYGDVDYQNKTITFRQNKTKDHSSKSGVVIPLNESLLQLIGEKPSDATHDTLIFKLPTIDSCLRQLHYWTKIAGINKNITWHSGRHSFGTQLLTNGANIKVVADLLGHSSLKYVEVYVRAVDEQKKKALDSLPKLDL